MPPASRALSSIASAAMPPCLRKACASLPPARKLPAEDTAELQEERPKSAGRLRIAVPLLPHIANFDDLDPLRLEPDVTLLLVPRGRPLPADADLVLLLGSKSVRADLAVFRKEGL